MFLPRIAVVGILLLVSARSFAACPGLNTLNLPSYTAGCSSSCAGGATHSCTPNFSIAENGSDKVLRLTKHYTYCGSGGGTSYDYDDVVDIVGMSSVCGSDLYSAIKAKRFPINPYCAGSIIQPGSQSLGESLSIVGAPFDLVYFSDRTAGVQGLYSVVTPIATTWRDGQLGSNVTVEDLSGNIFSTQTFVPSSGAGLYHSFNWNGLDYFGNPVQGMKFRIKTIENYSSISIPIVNEVFLGGFQAKKLGLGAWLPSLYSFYAVDSKTVYYATGSTREVSAHAILGGGYWVAEEDGSRVYVYDSSGNISAIKTSFLGTTIYSFSYNPSGKLTSISEPFGKVTAFNYDSFGNFQSITAPNGQVTSVLLESNGYLSQITNPNSESYLMGYSSLGLLLTFTKPGGQVSTFTYDADGKLTKDAHSGGFFQDLVETVTNNSGADVSLSTPMARIKRFEMSQSSSGGVISTYTKMSGSGVGYEDQYYKGVGGGNSSYSGAGYSYSNSTADDLRFGDNAQFTTWDAHSFGSIGLSTSYTQNATLSSSTDPFSITAYSETSQRGSYTTNTVFNPSTKEFTTTTGVGRSLTTTIDAYERVISSKPGNLTPTEFIYTNEKLTKIKQGARETILGYNAQDLVSTVTNPLSQTTGFVYDSAGRLTSTIMPDLRTIAYGYDGNGNVTSITPSGRPAHTFGFNANELNSSFVAPALTGLSSTSTNYVYDLDKQISQIQKPNGSTIDYSYDAVSGFLTQITTSAGAFPVAVDSGNGLISSIAQPTGNLLNLTYSGAIPSGYSYQNSAGTILGQYSVVLDSATGNVTSDSAGGPSVSTISYLYDNDEVLRKAGDIVLTYNTPNGQLTGITMGTGTTGFTDTYTYNAFGEVTGYNVKRGTTTIFDMALTRDALGRIDTKSQTMNSITEAYVYGFDSSGRLQQVTKNSSVVANYGYDSNSNRNSGNIGAQTTTATYDDQDRLTAYNSLTFTYNANGELQTKTNTVTSTTTNYTYDVFGNLTQVVLPGGTTTITYEIDGLNRRVGKKVNGVVQKRWVYQDQYRIAAELNASGSVTKRFVYGSKGNIPDYVIASGVKYRIVSDQLGSPRLVVKQSDGTITQRMNHDEFGRVTEDTNPGFLPFGFAGGLYDNQTGLVRFGARDYDPEIGRWTTKDPILFRGGSASLYSYVGNDPVNFVDITGLSQAQIDKALAWLKNNFPSVIRGADATLVDSKVPNFTGSDGLTVHKLIMINTIGQSDLDVLRLVIHELQHAKLGFWKNSQISKAEHVAIGLYAKKYVDAYLEQQIDGDVRTCEPRSGQVK